MIIDFYETNARSLADIPWQDFGLKRQEQALKALALIEKDQILRAQTSTYYAWAWCWVYLSILVKIQQKLFLPWLLFLLILGIVDYSFNTVVYKQPFKAYS